MGVTGAGLASAIAVVLGTITYVALALRYSRADGFGRRGTANRDTLDKVLSLSWPAGIRGLFFSGGIMAFYRIAEVLGTQELAITTVLINLALVCMLPALGFGLASATFVGQALGRGRPLEAARWAWTTVLLAVCTLALLGLALMVAPELWLGLLMEDAVAELRAVVPLLVVAVYQPLDAVGQVLSQSLVGAGAVRIEAAATLGTQWCVFLPLAYIWAVQLGGGLLVLWIAMLIWRVLYSVLLVVIFRRGRWAMVEV